MKCKAAILCFFVFTTTANAQQKEVLLWPGGAPGASTTAGNEVIRVVGDDQVIKNIHRPSITVYLPAKDNATGAAVVIAPGGGHRELWITHEGYNEAKWLSERGVAAFVLKYRLARDSNSTYTIDKDELADIQRAIRLVKSRAKEWGVDSAKVGVMGFSAGGEVAALSAMKFDSGNPGAADPVDQLTSRPAFQALIYPANSARYEVAPNAPPVFLLGGFNDRADIAEGLAQVYLKYKKAGVPAELHIYSNAGHGFGMRASTRGAVAGWIDHFYAWLNDRGFLGK